MENSPRPENMRSLTTGKLELRKLWSVPKAEFIYALFVEVKTETAEVVDGKPNWDNITDTEVTFQTPQGYVGDEEWAKKTAEHFEIEFPEEEWKDKEDTEEKTTTDTEE